ncbi:MAG: hypothetical protein C0402_00750 [Thermodesulfovibrio sp.]|nr:hypothetical protein [Thermodesulfovibrio sp.]
MRANASLFIVHVYPRNLPDNFRKSANLFAVMQGSPAAITRKIGNLQLAWSVQIYKQELKQGGLK